MKVTLPPLSPHALMQKIVAHHDIFAGCRMTVFLSSGNTVQGDLLTVEPSGREISGIALQAGDGSITWIEAKAVQAISLLSPTAAGLSVLSNGAVDPLDFAEVPTKLGLQREMKSQAEVLSNHFGNPIHLDTAWEEIPDAKAMTALKLLVQDTVAALLALASDNFGKEQVLAQCHRVRFIPSGEKRLHIADDTLHIAFGWQLDQRWQKADLANQINKAL